MKKKIIFTLLFSLSYFLTHSQKVNFSHSLKTSIFFGKKLRLIVSYDMNIGKHLVLDNSSAITPFVDLKINLYRNFLGSSVVSEFRHQLNGNLAFSPGIYFSKKPTKNDANFIPIFASSFSNSYNSNYKKNIGFNSTYIFQFGIGKNKPYRWFQSVANIFTSWGDFYMNYYNDGGPLLDFIGDKEDRYWTGGLTVGLTSIFNNQKHSFEISYDKFTGFFKDAFEASGLLFIDKVNYKNLEEVSYNSGKSSFSYFNHSSSWGVSINRWNAKSDFQDWLHRAISHNPYHHKLVKPSIDFAIFNYQEL